MYSPAGESEKKPRFCFSVSDIRLVTFNLIAKATIEDDISFVLWPIMGADPEGRLNEFSESAMEGAHEAVSRWVRLSKAAKRWEYRIADEGFLPEPTWPTESMKVLIEGAFKGHILRSVQDKVIQKLAGKVQQ
jgi:hypothetical protein